MITVIPYIEIDGCRTIPDQKMLAIYETMKAEGNLRRVFYHYGNMSAYDFLAFCKNTRNYVFVGWDGDVPILISWINEVVGKRGTINFCSMGKYTRRKIEAARETLRLVLGLFDVVVGLIPDTYEDVKKFTRKLGFTDLGVIPYFTHIEGKQVSANIQFLAGGGNHE